MSSRICLTILALAALGLTAWVFYLTRSPWSFLILVLLGGLSIP